MYSYFLFSAFQTQSIQIEFLFGVFQTCNILKYLFPVPKDDSQRVVTFINWDDWILFRQHTYKKTNEGKDYELNEIGPRFSMKCKEMFMLYICSILFHSKSFTINACNVHMQYLVSFKEGHRSKAYMNLYMEDIQCFTLFFLSAHVNSYAFLKC